MTDRMITGGDVLLYQTTDGGEIEVENGSVTMTGGLGSAAYLSLFGGGRNDDNTASSTKQWFGNALFPDRAERQYRNRLQYELDRLPAVPANLLKLQQAAEKDLEWITDQNIASSIDVSVSMPGLNKIAIVLQIFADGDTIDIRFLENWKAGQ